MKRFFLLTCVAALLLAAAFVSAADVIKFPVRVQKGNEPVLDLKAENFQVSAGKNTAAPEKFLGTETPILIVLVFDTTGDKSYIDAMREELCKFVANLPPTIQIMVMNAAGGLKVIQNNTGKADLLTQAIRSYNTGNAQPGFMENILNVGDSTNGLLQKNNIRVCTIFITDSEIYKYRKRYTTGDFTTEVEGIKEKLRGMCAPIFCIRLPIGNNDTFNRTYEGSIREMVKLTGGEAEFPMGLNGVGSALVSILHRIHGTYILSVPAGEKGKEMKIKVTLTGAEGKPEYKQVISVAK